MQPGLSVTAPGLPAPSGVTLQLGFMDMLQMQAVETLAAVEPAPPPVMSPPPPPSNPVRVPAAAAVPPPLPAVVPPPPPAPADSLKLRRSDPTHCVKCVQRFASRGDAHLIMLRQILLKWLPNARFEYPEQLFAEVIGLDARGDDWLRTVVSVCKQCRQEIQALKTIPSRTQLAPWLHIASDAEANDTRSDANARSSKKKRSKKEKEKRAGKVQAHVLPYLARAPELHPSQPGFGSQLSPPAAKTSTKLTRVPMTVALLGENEVCSHARTEQQRKHTVA